MLDLHSLRLHYLDLSATCRSDRPLDELDLELAGLAKGLGSVPRLQALALELMAQPASSEALRLAERTCGALAASQQEIFDRPFCGFPLTPEIAAQIQVCLSAWQSLGEAYARWCLAFEKVGGAGLLVGAIACLKQIVLLGGFCHGKLPDGLWLDLHALFRLAQKAGLARTRCKWQRTSVSPEEEYLKALLLGLADPYGLLPQEVFLLDRLLEKWAPLAKVLDTAQEGWVIDEAEDAPAKWCTIDQRQNLFLDLTGLAKLFAQHKHLASAAGRFESWRQPASTVTAALLESLERRWFQPQAETAGFAADACEWVVGLKDIFARLNGEKVAVVGGGTQIDPLPETIQLGDLVGVFSPSSEMLSLAVVARVECSRSLKVRLEAMPGAVFPVGIQPLYRIKQPCAYQRGLLLAEAKQVSLLLAEQPLSDGLVVRLLYGDKHYPVRLAGCQNPARGILRCRCISAADLIQK